MTHSRSYTSATPAVSRDPLRDRLDHSTSEFGGAPRATDNSRARLWWRVACVSIVLLGALLRVLRLSWQPLWWDEGYSIFFATESLTEMLRLTALDIHPPLYYALLHGWFRLLGDTGPVTARLFSVIVGVLTLPAMTWASLTLWPRQRWLALTATLFLAISPIHIFYSQEVRMYGLALLLTLLASTYFWQVRRGLEAGERPFKATTGYVVTASLALLTLYYAGLVLLAHQLWALFDSRRQGRRLLWPLAAALLILLIQLPWWLYALPKLFVYVGDKVLADQDLALPLWSYVWRHWLAFLTGHVSAPQPWLAFLRQLAAALVAALAAICLYRARDHARSAPLRYATVLVIVPMLVGYLINLVYPFFPDGGERLLLHLLPYLLLVIAWLAWRAMKRSRYLALALFLMPIVAAAIGTGIYFATPRYTGHDYRPIIAAVSQQSRGDDTVLALFPWQVGYWRAYSPRTMSGELLPPQPAAVGQSVLQWNEQFRTDLDAALERGTLWFPMPLSFGSTLPPLIEEYLLTHARNLENTWFPTATRLTAWVKLETPEEGTDLNIAYADGLTVQRASVAPRTVASANQPVAIDLCWQPPATRPDLRATLRLVDRHGHTWASRDLPKLAAYIGSGTNACLEQIALNIPTGLPPDSYTLALGIGPESSDQLLTPLAAETPFITLATLTVTAPASPLSHYRLPISHHLPSPIEDNGLLIHGYTGPDESASLLAGDEVALTLYLQNISPNPPARQLYVAILDHQGSKVAGWQDWPLPDDSTDTLQEGALVQIPVQFYLPAGIDATRYSLTAGFVDSGSGAQSTSATLAHVQVARRAATFTEPVPAQPLTPAPTLGTHATLTGYALRQDGTTLQLDLTWHVAQPLLPPHHIFVHLLDGAGTQLTQSDGEPITRAGRAPTGSWLPGEYLTTHHEITIPDRNAVPESLRVGLYLPATGARLPITIDGDIVGDSVTIPYNVAP